jgi:hypothetical protein
MSHRQIQRAFAGVAAFVVLLGAAQPVGATPDPFTDDSVPVNTRVDQFGQDVNKPTFDVPVVALSYYELTVDEVMTVTVAGFKSRIVTIALCGNKALRGSSDCNVLESEGLGLEGDGSAKLARLPAAAPPVPCPCVVRVTSSGSSEVAVADVTLIGHPVADLVEPAGYGASLSVAMSAEPASAGAAAWVRSSLGGRTVYDVTVTIKNPLDRVVDGVTITGTVGRDSDDVIAALEFGSPGIIGAGQTWEETVRVELPAPVFGKVEWDLDVANAGPTVGAADTTSHLPGLLLIAAAFLATDVAILLVRFRRRRRRQGQGVVLEQGVRQEHEWAPAHRVPDTRPLVVV